MAGWCEELDRGWLQAGEIISFDNDIRGVALNLEYNAVGVVILGDDRYIREGSIAQRTRDMFKVS